MSVRESERSARTKLGGRGFSVFQGRTLWAFRPLVSEAAGPFLFPPFRRRQFFGSWCFLRRLRGHIWLPTGQEGQTELRSRRRRAWLCVRFLLQVPSGRVAW